MRKMNLIATYPNSKLSKRHPEHRIYPYLLKGLAIVRTNQVRYTDITYIQRVKGFCYLVAVMGRDSRYILSWRVSNTLEADFCGARVEGALAYGRSEIFNLDQGSQFISKEVF